MKRLAIPLLLMFLALGFAPESKAEMRAATAISFPDNKSEIKANMKLAKKFMEKGKYAQAKKCLDKVLELDPNHAEAQQLLAECEQHLEAQRALEQIELIEALTAGTEQALQNFIATHPDSDFVPQAEAYLADHQLWSTARQTNTKEGYLDYLRQSTLKSYKTEAEEAIRQFEMEEAWNECHNSGSTTLLERFIETYPTSIHVNDAQYELHLTKAKTYYDNHQNDLALRHYQEAHKIHPLTGEHERRYQELKIAKRFEELKTSSDLEALQQFYAQLPNNSPYLNTISNRIAVVRANRLNSYSTENDYNNALYYACDDITKNYVNGKISAAKKSQRERVREEKREKRKADRAYRRRHPVKFFSVGWDIADCYLGKDFFNVETGINFRFGQCNHVFNFLIGANAQYFIPTSDLSDFYYYQSWDFDSFFKFAIPASIRFNIGEVFYVGVGAICWPNKETGSSPTWAIEPQLGLCSPHFEFGVNARFFYETYDFAPYYTHVGPMIGYRLAVNF